MVGTTGWLLLLQRVVFSGLRRRELRQQRLGEFDLDDLFVETQVDSFGRLDQHDFLPCAKPNGWVPIGVGGYL